MGTARLAMLEEQTTQLASGTPDVRLEEADDVCEVMLGLVAHAGHSLDDHLIAAADRKRAERGGFSGRVWLEFW